jgi:hypothetical protein
MPKKRDFQKLRPGALVRLLNSTPLGEVLTDSRLRRHRARAGLRLGDGQTIDLFRYAAWLADEVGELAPSAPAGDEALRWRHYAAIPHKHWVEMSGRQAKVLYEQAERYGLPFGGPTIHLPDFVRALHDFLAVHARRLARSIGRAGGDEDESEETSDALELFRGERYLREKLKRLAEEGELLPRAEVHVGLARIAALLRGCGELLQKKYGPDAQEVLDATLDDCRREVETLLGAPALDAPRPHEDRK